jgi:hypothetical protein
MITEIKSGKTLYALVFDFSSLKEGTFPATPATWPLQTLIMKRKQGHVVRKHLHKKILRTSRQPQEALVVVKGAVETRIFDRKGKFIAKRKVLAGQCLFLAEGAHEVKILKNALMYEFKTGPYADDKLFL